MDKIPVRLSVPGVALGLVAFALYSVGDSLIRALGPGVPAYELAFIGAVASLVLSPLTLGGRVSLNALVRPNRWRWWCLRGLFAVGGTIAGIYAWSTLPLAETSSILFINPLLTSALTPALLAERVRRRDWIASTVGFAGVLMVLRPGFQHLAPGHICAVVCAACGAGTGLLLRATRTTETPAAMHGASVLSVILVAGIGTACRFVLPAPADMALIAGYTLFCGLAGIILMYAWRRGPAGLIAPTQYSQVIWGIALGYFCFAEIPNATTVWGALFVVLAGAVTLSGNSANSSTPSA